MSRFSARWDWTLNLGFVTLIECWNSCFPSLDISQILRITLSHWLMLKSVETSLGAHINGWFLVLTIVSSTTVYTKEWVEEKSSQNLETICLSSGNREEIRDSCDMLSHHMHMHSYWEETSWQVPMKQQTKRETGHYTSFPRQQWN